jgi:hypothetical protein
MEQKVLLVQMQPKSIMVPKVLRIHVNFFLKS